jgi:phosphoribosylglycinamide formyltransferase-1
MGERLNVAVLISGRGSNLQSIIDACANPDFPASVKVVLSNEPDAYGLERATQAGIPTEIVPHKAHPSRKEFEEAMQAVLAKYDIDLICLAGFMRVLTSDFVAKWEGRMLNIHPSLLPAYPGLHTHERVLANHEKESGCTIHFVTPGLDEGPTLLQKRVPVLQNDTAETLAARVLEQEHIAYPEAIRLLALGKVHYSKEQVEVDDVEPYAPPRTNEIAAPADHTHKSKEIPSMDHHNPSSTHIDPAAIAQAKATWSLFAEMMKYSVIGSAGILTLMALSLL